MATLQSHFHLSLSNSPKLIYLNNRHSFSFSKKVFSPKKLFFPNRFNGVLRSRFITSSLASSANTTTTSSSAEIEKAENERPSFDINLAVILAGFAFEAYITPPDKTGRREMDAAKCQTVFLSESFVREIYDGQLFVKLKKGFNFPAMDPWGTSDPYVIMQLDCQIVKSNVKWGTKEPKWNEEFALNIKQPPIHDLQVAAWDANLVAPHKRMGNSCINLENLCDGNSHEVLLDLEGMGGGGKIEMEVNYKSFGKIDDEKKWWKIPLVTEFLEKHGLDPALKMFVGSETVQARDFVQFAFGQFKSLNDSYLQKDWFSGTKVTSDPDPDVKEKQSKLENNEGSTNKDSNDETLSDDDVVNNVKNYAEEVQVVEDSRTDKQFWKTLADTVNQNVVQKLGLPAPEKMKWDEFDLLKNFGLLSREIAEASYVESGLATSNGQEADAKDGLESGGTQQTSSLADIKKITQDILRQTDSILGALMVVNAAVSKLSNESGLIGKHEDTPVEVEEEVPGDEGSKSLISNQGGLTMTEEEAEEMRKLFSTAESAMEAWALLANALGHPTFIKSEFEKICFLDNAESDTQVAIWRDLERRRLVVAFRGTEQTRWKDVVTDLMLVPTGLNPERIGGDSTNEVQVHSGFLSAYDSVRTRLITLIKQATGHRDDDSTELLPTWHIYVTGHSLGGALATLLALELASSQLAQYGAIAVTMYNFGSPRVGNRRFAEIYNQKVKDSWRVINHRDIIPTVPRLMGYCHVAHPVYLAAGNQKDDMENLDVLEVGYEADIIGEATPDVLVSEFMKGEKELIENILNTEINIFRGIRDGSAVMQHMEDFYYISLLEKVKSNYKGVGGFQPAAAGKKLSA
ncbi:hypothetical protein AAHA92_16561 [Salvia divinorum]|uniref:C2 domain-containing protein n=1 Tax=Salvia divinorum TaxID=28513 RepID=A0ABD1GX12_SALDI